MVATALFILLICVLFLSVLFIQTNRTNGSKEKPPEQDPALDVTAVSALRKLLDRLDDPAFDREVLRLDLLQFRAQYPGTPQALVATEQLTHLPSPLDKLEKAKPLDRGVLPPFVERMNAPARDALVNFLGRPRAKNESPLWSVAISPDCKTIATSGQDSAVHLWDAATARERGTLSGHAGPIGVVAFSPDGKTLASGSHDGKVKLWDVPAGRERATLTGHTHRLDALAFAPDSKLLASASHDGTVRLWDTASGKERASVTAPEGRMLSVAFAPDGKTLATGGTDQSVRLWDVTPKIPAQLAAWEETKSWVHVSKFTPDGRFLLYGGGGDGNLLLGEWNANEFISQSLFPGRRSVVQNAVFTPDGKTLITADRDGNVQFRDRASGDATRQAWLLPGGEIHALALASDGRHLIVASEAGVAFIFRLSSLGRKP